MGLRFSRERVHPSDGRSVNALRECLDREAQFRSRSIGDVNASFARIKCICTPLKARRDPDELRFIAQAFLVLASLPALAQDG